MLDNVGNRWHMCLTDVNRLFQGEQLVKSGYKNWPKALPVGLTSSQQGNEAITEPFHSFS
jgi:hypothetical protein